MKKFSVLCLLALLPANFLFATEISELAARYPVEFCYEGKAFEPGAWSPEEKKVDDLNSQMVYTSPDGKLRLTITYRKFEGFPVTEVRPVLECVGNESTGIVDDFKSLRLTRECQSHGVKVRRITGAVNDYTDFCHQDAVLQRRHECDWLHMSSSQGRSVAWLPYIGIDFDVMNGVELAIGWTGTWRADMQYGEKFWLTTGLLGPVHFRMLPGEKFQMPYVVIYEREQKTVEQGLAEFRRFVIEHKSPRDENGEIFEPIFPFSVSGGNKTDDNMLKILDCVVNRFQIPFNVLWVDAGWYGEPEDIPQDGNCGPFWYKWAGYWKPNTVIHPDGNLKKISKAAHKNGMRFLVWFEPERATKYAPITQEHPEYFHRHKVNPSDECYLLDMGNPEARAWVTDEVSRNIRESGIDIYRQDFNCDPLPIWRDNDAEDRQSVSEIRHINGLYAYWDELHRRFPSLMFENCAGGGTRMDIEMMSRSHSYCRDDAHMRPNCDELTQNITLNTTSYIPFTGGETFTVPVFDTYAFLSRLGASAVFTPSDFQGMILHREPGDEEVQWFRTMWDVTNRIRSLYFGDFYALTQDPFYTPDIYCGYQLNDTKKGEGFYMLFRRQACPEENFLLKLRDIDPDATYQVEEFEGEKRLIKGKEFVQQLLYFPNPRSYKLVFYKKL